MPAITLSHLESVQIGQNVLIQVRKVYRGKAILYIDAPPAMGLTQFSRQGTGRPFRTPVQQVETVNAVNKVVDGG